MDDYSNVEILSFACPCGKIIKSNDTDDHHKMCLPYWERRLEARKARLVRLKDLEAPPSIIESEKELIKRAATAIKNIKLYGADNGEE